MRYFFRDLYVSVCWCVIIAMMKEEEEEEEKVVVAVGQEEEFVREFIAMSEE